MHIAIFSINLALAVFGLSSEIAAWSLQVGRRQSPELVGECEQEIEYVLPLAIMTSVGISFLYLLGIFCCMAIVYIYNLRGGEV